MNVSMSGRTSAKRRVRLLIMLGGVLAGLLLAEVGLRLIGFRYLNLYQEDREVGFALRPGAEGWWRSEGEAYIKISSAGLRDREHSQVKPSGTLRVAVLGDSYAEALQVPLEAAFWAVAEKRLEGCATFGGRKVEVINFGVSGFSTARELITLRRRVWQYSPDIVILLMTTGNDIRDNSLLLSREYAGLPLPYFIYKDDTLVLDDSLLRRRNESLKFHLQESFLGGALGWSKNNVRLLGLIDKARSAFQTNKVRRENSPTVKGYEPGIDAKVYLEPTDPAWHEAWRVTEGLMLMMRDEVKSHGAKFLLVTGSNGIQVNPDPAVRQGFMRSLGAVDLFYPDRRIKALGEREGVEVLNVAPALKEYAERNQTLLHALSGFGHWNALGHRMVGEMIAEKLCEPSATHR
jgi:hypothetical protein